MSDTTRQLVWTKRPKRYNPDTLLQDIAELNEVLKNTLKLDVQLTLEMDNQEGIPIVEIVQRYITKRECEHSDFAFGDKYIPITRNAVHYFMTVGAVRQKIDPEDELPIWQVVPTKKTTQKCRCNIL